MKRKTLIFGLIAVLLYASSYIWLRQTHAEVWEKDGDAYVIFPEDKTYLYYFFRPFSYFDGIITGMKFHIGQHK